MNSLEQILSLNKTVIVADTGDLEAIASAQPRDATTNPSLILQAACDHRYKGLVHSTINEVFKSNQSRKENLKGVLEERVDTLSVVFGHEILKLIEGRVSTEVDARLSFDEEGTVTKAKKLIAMYEKRGVDKNRILIKIAATWE